MSGWSLGVELDSMWTPMCSFAAGPLAHLIDGDGTFNVTGTENFVKEVELAKCGHSYAVVSIMGPQSSGKSTLLNCLFGTKFREMDAQEGRYQTTKGIWVAKCARIEPCTLVMDLEGTDGMERGEQVKVKLFTPRKITLLLVIRDKTRTPLERLKELLQRDIEKIWQNITKSKADAHNETPLSEFFDVEVVALSSYEKEEEKFKEEVARLRQQICHSIIQGELARDWSGVVHASDFPYSCQKIWEKIKADKDLDLPSHKVMVATVRCEKIATEKYETFVANEAWRQLEEDMNGGPTPEFVHKLNSQIDACLSAYDAETTYYDEGPRSKYQNQLKEKLLQLFVPAFASELKHIRSRILDKFKHSFDAALNGGEEFYAAGSNCIVSCMSHFDEACADVVIEKANEHKIEVRKKLQRDITSVLTSSCQAKLKEALSGPVEEALLDGNNRDPWQSIRKLLRHEIESTVSQFFAALTGFDIDGDTRKKMIESLEDYARRVVEEKARDEATRVLMRMKTCFESRFTMFRQFGRVWTGKDDIPAAAKAARCASLTLLSVLAVIRLDDDDTDDIERKLKAELMDSSSSATKDRSSEKFDPLWLASDGWEQTASCPTLIGPRLCKKLWVQFMQETEPMISKAEQQGDSTWSSTFYKFASVFFSVAGGAAINSSLGREVIMSLLAALLMKRPK